MEKKSHHESDGKTSRGRTDHSVCFYRRQLRSCFLGGGGHCIDSCCRPLLVRHLSMRKKGKKPAWIPFLLPPLPPMWTSPWLRWLPSLHRVNVPSCRTNLAQSVWTAAHSEIPRLEKAPLAVCHLLNMRLTLAGLDARFMGGILEACGGNQ